MIKFAQAIRLYRHALLSQLQVHIKTTIVNTRLGPLWLILDPLVLMLIYTFVIKVIFERGGPGYHIFILCGIVTWQTFTRSLTICTKSMRANASLILQIALPLQMYVLIPCIVQSFFYMIGLLMIACLNFSIAGMQTLWILLLPLPMLLFPFALGLFFAVFEVQLPDIGKFLPYALRIGFYLSPVLYSPEKINSLEKMPETLKSIYMLNPMLHLITAARDILFTGATLNFKVYTILIVTSLILVQAGLLFFRGHAHKIPKVL